METVSMGIRKMLANDGNDGVHFISHFSAGSGCKKKTEENNCSEYDKMLKYLLE